MLIMVLFPGAEEPSNDLGLEASAEASRSTVVDYAVS